MFFKPHVMLVANLLLAVCFCALVVAQSVRDLGNQTLPAPSKRTNTPVRTVYKTRVERGEVGNTGTLSVAAEPDASILVEPLDIDNRIAQQAVVPAGERVFVFSGLKPGRYRVAGALAGYQPTEGEVTIEKNRHQTLTLNFVPILYRVTVTTNVAAAELKYAREGNPLKSVIPILNRSAQLDLPAGVFTVEITTNEFGYKSLRKSVSVTAERTWL